MKNKTKLKRIVILVGILIGLWLLIRFTGIIQFYTTSSSGNSPNINPGDWIIATNLTEPERLDFICYYQKNTEEVWVRRLCALQGDTVIIKDGILFVNGLNMDESISLMHDYVFDCQTAREYEDEISWATQLASNDSCRIAVVDNKINRNSSTKQFISKEKGLIDSSFDPNWTMDNFGPLIIPEGFVFVLGDNRHQSIGSRITGLIREESVNGVVL